jgi:SAM-dependent methyltransferase
MTVVVRPAARSKSAYSPRLYPSRLGGRYYIATVLRQAYERWIDAHLMEGRPFDLVDFGCGDMPYRPLFEARGAIYTGVDLPDNPLADAHLDAEGRIGLPDACADLVLSSQVLEHVPAPDAYLAEAMRVLRPGGTLLLSTHGFWKHHPHPLDLWRWSCQGLRRVVEQAGYDVIEFRGVMGMGATGLLLLQDAVVVKLPKPTRKWVAAAFQPFIALADRIHTQADRDRDAAVFFVSARKPG